jgi:hypothetical protein
MVREARPRFAVSLVLDLLEGEGLDDVELPVEVVAHASTRVRRSTAA